MLILWFSWWWLVVDCMLVFALSNFVLRLYGVFMKFGLGLCCLWLLRWVGWFVSGSLWPCLYTC